MRRTTRRTPAASSTAAASFSAGMRCNPQPSSTGFTIPCWTFFGLPKPKTYLPTKLLIGLPNGVCSADLSATVLARSRRLECYSLQARTLALQSLQRRVTVNREGRLLRTNRAVRQHDFKQHPAVKDRHILLAAGSFQTAGSIRRLDETTAIHRSWLAANDRHRQPVCCVIMVTHKPVLGIES